MKKYFIEFLGTFFLVLVIGLSANPLAIGAILMCMVYMGGHLSGAHYNPAVSLSIFLDQKMSFFDLLMYWISQIFGGFVAAFTVHLLSKKLLSVLPSASWELALPIEILFTLALVLVVLNVADHPRTEKNSFYGLAVGFTVLAAAFSGGNLSGGAFNPAVGLGPWLYQMVIGKTIPFHQIWIYVVGPLTGSLLATLIFQFTKDA